MTDHRTPAEIEREIEHERALLAESLNGLRQSISVEGITRQIASEVSQHGGEFGRSVSRSVKDNPIALALTGVGLAWMIFSDSQRRTDSSYGNGGDSLSADPYAASDHGSSGASGAVSAARDKAGAAASSVGYAAASASESVSRGWDSATGAAARGWDGVSRGTGEMARSARARSAELRDRISEGTEDLSAEARRRVIAARQAAVDAWSEVERTSRRGVGQAADLFEEQPLIAGALALAVGAALGGALPRSKTEDEAVGAHSDRLFDEARRVYEEENAKLKKTAKSVGKEAKAAAADLKKDLDARAPGNKTAAAAAGDEIKATAKRVTRKAKTEAEKQDLGNVKKPARGSGRT